ncbi:RT0821/Lpp0805 family surface protein [Limibacillus halophilus]|jgi:surface antigen
MLKKTTVSALALLSLVTVGCENYGTKQTVGTLAGAAGGAVIGSQIGGGSGQLAAVAVGTLLGGLLGSEIGRQMDERDQLLHQQAYQEARSAPIGETITWDNPNNGHSGSVTPVREGTSSSGAYCREFQQTIIVGGKAEEAYGTACQQPDGSWKIVQ